MRKLLSASLLAAATLLTAGCSEPAPKPAAVPPSPPPQRLRLLVVDDPALAQKIGRVKGEWEARSGAPLEIKESTPTELAAAKALDSDAIIYPAGELGGLAERHLLRPIPPAWLNRPEYAKKDLFELPGLQETSWGEQIYAVPLGSPVLVLCYRADLFARVGKQPPQTWTEYQSLVDFFDQRENLTAENRRGLSPFAESSEQNPPRRTPPGGSQLDAKLKLPPDWHGTLEPLAPGWAGKMLLARAAAYAKHRDYFATLFDRDTMAPRIAEPPFVRALTELVAAAKTGSGAKPWLESTPADVRAAFFQGRAAMALTWPTAADTPPAGSPAELPLVGFVELPGSLQVFSQRDRNWVPRTAAGEVDDSHVPLLCVAGRLGSVVQKTAAGDAALELLLWLSTGPWDRQICTASPATTLFRHSQLAEPSRWVEPGLSAAAVRQYAEVEARACTRGQWLFAPRLPGHAEYLAALDDAVRRAVSGQRSPQEALTEAAARWQEITARLGLEAQRSAYLRSIGLEP